jgi:hypothetical protein
MTDAELVAGAVVRIREYHDWLKGARADARVSDGAYLGEPAGDFLDEHTSDLRHWHRLACLALNEVFPPIERWRNYTNKEGQRRRWRKANGVRP